MALRPKPKREPWWPSPFEPNDAYAIKALARSEDTQIQRAFKWIMDATGVRDEMFVQGQDDTRTYLMGRRSIGLQIAHLIEWMPPKKEPNTDV